MEYLYLLKELQIKKGLTHCCLLTPYGNIDLGVGIKPLPELILTIMFSVIMKGVLWHSPESNFTSAHELNPWYAFRDYTFHDDVIKWKHFQCYWPFVQGIHRSPVNSLRKGQWRGALMFSLICVWINGWVNNREAGGLRRYHAHYDVNVM